MAEKKGVLEIVRFQKNVPVVVYRKTGSTQDGQGTLLDHWHAELELVYTFHGHAVHYIDGRRHIAKPGSLFIVNSESIHKILPDEESNAQYSPDELVAVVVHVEKNFLDTMIPDMKDKYFLPEAEDPTEMTEELGRVFRCLGEQFAGERKIPGFEWFHLMSYIDEILYLICKTRLVCREAALPINNEKNLERLRGVMQWVSEHYAEEISQQFVAKKFYFTKEYFARFFKQNTGMTFMEYVTRYRVDKAETELLSTDHTVLETALDCGFSDARGFINAFRKYRGSTPLQYRKHYRQQRENDRS